MMTRESAPLSRLTVPMILLGVMIAMGGMLAIMQQAWGADGWHETIVEHPRTVEQIADEGRTVNPRRYEDRETDYHREPPAIDREFRVSVPHRSEYDYREMLVRLVIHSDGRIDSRHSGNTDHMRGHYRLVAEAPREAVDQVARLAELDTHDHRARSQWAEQIPAEPGAHAQGPTETFRVYIEEAEPGGWRDRNLSTDVMTSLAMVIVGAAICLGAMIREAVRQQRLAPPAPAEGNATT